MFTEDFSTFFNADEFGVQALLDGVAVVGILEPGFADGTLDGYGDGPGSSPSFTLPSSSVPSNPQGLTLQILNGTSAGLWRIGTARHDGAGVCVLSLT